ncbi:nucleoside hydrolase [Streptomyces sp. NPDC050658]|uniref:nucleoside hydrolase n=1 Tax=unclassified Streptomyces TaxID=2593676 RepID=UPI003433BCA0
MSDTSLPARAPLIIDTDIGGEPDDAMALAVAARRLPDLALVTTCDETDGERARFARHFLDLLGRPDVAVASGPRLGEDPYFWAKGIAPADVAPQPNDPVAAVRAVCARVRGPVRWLGLGPLTNLAAVLARAPGTAPRLQVTQMGGALSYRDATLAQYNFRLDPGAARAVVAGCATLRLVTYDVTFSQQLVLTPDSSILRSLAGMRHPWAKALTEHCAQYFAGYYPSTIPHTPLSLSAAMGEPFIRFASRRIALDEAARMRLSDEGDLVRLSVSANYPDFLGWLENCLA